MIANRLPIGHLCGWLLAALSILRMSGNPLQSARGQVY
jgi:hypothetical protein